VYHFVKSYCEIIYMLLGLTFVDFMIQLTHKLKYQVNAFKFNDKTLCI